MLHHPDKGGDTALMQQVNTEFGKLFEVWKDKPCVSTTPTGYEHDFQDATAKEYTEYVYNEYRWKGRNYNGQSRAGNHGTGQGMAQGDLSEIHLLGPQGTDTTQSLSG